MSQVIISDFDSNGKPDIIVDNHRVRLGHYSI